MGSGFYGSNTHKQCSPGARCFEPQPPQIAACFHPHFPTALCHATASVILLVTARTLRCTPSHSEQRVGFMTSDSSLHVVLLASSDLPGRVPLWGPCLRGTLFTHSHTSIPHLLPVFVRMSPFSMRPILTTLNNCSSCHFLAPLSCFQFF